TAPTFTPPANTTLEVDEMCGYNVDPAITGEPTNVEDNCDPNPTVDYTDAEVECIGNDSMMNINAGQGDYFYFEISGYDDLTAADLGSFLVDFSTSRGTGRAEFTLVAPGGDGIMLVGP